METPPLRRLRALPQLLCNSLHRRNGRSPADSHSRAWSARPDEPSRRPRAAMLAAMAMLLVAPQVGLAQAESSRATISGTTYQDFNRDGIQQVGEAPFEDHVLYLFDGNGDLVATDATDVEGRYSFSDLPVGDYEVRYMPRTWRGIYSDWVPTTTGSLYPEKHVTLDGSDITLDFGWRPIEWSDDIGEPISELVGHEGLKVQSYNDAVSAQEIYDYIVENFRVDGEAPTTTVRFAYGSLNRAQTSILYDNSAVTGVRTVAYASYERMLNRGSHQTLAHEYGHAWMNYHSYYIQQDGDREWLAFLEARGIDADDDRLGSSHQWQPVEIAAEDYRQLFTTEATSSDRHMNRDIPDAWEVEGLKEFLSEEFTTPVEGHPHYEQLVVDDDAAEDDGAGNEDGIEDDSASTDDGKATQEDDDAAEDDGAGNEDGVEDDGASANDDGATDDDEADDEGVALRISSPASGDEVDPELTIAGEVTAAFTRVDVTIAGGSQRAELTDDGTWRVRFSNVPAGEHEIEALARGPRGLRAQATVVVTVTGGSVDDGGSTDGTGNNGNGRGGGPKK